MKKDVPNAILEYTNLLNLEKMITDAVEAIKRGEEPENAEKVLKYSPTGILLASPENEKLRHRPGSRLVTYTGIDDNGELIQETWGGGVADVKEDSVILRNDEPIRYPENHELAGEVVRGNYRPNGEFEINPEGEEELFNEYVSNVEYVEKTFEKIPQPQKWLTGFKQDPTYAIEIPNIIIKTDEAEINLKPGDAALIQTKRTEKGLEITSVHGAEKKAFESTYISFEEG